MDFQIKKGINMTTYECTKCGMSVNATCGKCNETLVNDILKLDDNNDAAKHKTITKEQARLIIDSRTSKKWKQKDLANNINVSCKIINDYECCRAIPDNKIVSKLERILNIKLRNKK